MLMLLLRSRNDSVADNDSPAAIAAAMQSSFRDAVVIGRQGARERGLSRLVAEADAIDVPLDVSSADMMSFGRDWIRADRVSRSFSERWVKAANELESTKAASAETLSALERIAVTESSEAFSSGRSVALATHPSTELMRVWDATLDKRTCDVCEGADGTMVGASQAFSVGEPGAVHSNCRCSWALTTVSFSAKAKH